MPRGGPAVTHIDVEIPCPHCHSKFKLLLEDLRPGEGRPCPNCGSTITFAGADGSKVQGALDELSEQVPGISTKIKISIKKKPRTGG